MGGVTGIELYAGVPAEVPPFRLLWSSNHSTYAVRHASTTVATAITFARSNRVLGRETLFAL